MGGVAGLSHIMYLHLSIYICVCAFVYKYVFLNLFIYEFLTVIYLTLFIY